MRQPGATLGFLCLFAILCCSELATGQASPKKSEILRSFPINQFYDTPQPLPSGSPGELIRSESFEEYNLPEDVNAIRILYHSRSATGEDVASSGVILYPEEEQPPAGGWPVIAWAHPWTGVARDCAPSLDRDLQRGSFLAMYVRLGYAVVATDYTGLGTNLRAAFANAQANAGDVIHSIAAARKALPQLGSRWIAMGTGEGAAAAMAVAEAEHGMRDAGYLGSIAVSGLADLQDVYDHSDVLPYEAPLFLAYGIQTAEPQFNPADILSDKGLRLYAGIDKTCNEAETGRGISTAAVVKPDWERNQYVQNYFSRTRVGLKPADAPLLVISGETEPARGEAAKVVGRLCKQGDRVDFETYPESDPSSVIGDSVRDQIGWVQARFANKPARSNCSIH